MGSVVACTGVVASAAFAMPSVWSSAPKNSAKKPAQVPISTLRANGRVVIADRDKATQSALKHSKPLRRLVRELSKNHQVTLIALSPTQRVALERHGAKASQAVRIVAIDGEPIHAKHTPARRLVAAIGRLPKPVRPNLVAAPWRTAAKAFDRRYVTSSGLVFGFTTKPRNQQRNNLKPAKRANRALGLAKSQLGKPYRWGGSSPSTSFDCSGLVQWAYGRNGVRIPRVAADQFRTGQKVPVNKALPGDLVFFGRGYVHHVGMVVKPGVFIHAPHTGSRISYANLNGRYRSTLAGVRRYLKPARPPKPKNPVRKLPSSPLEPWVTPIPGFTGLGIPA